jgi:hypothetical protein
MSYIDISKPVYAQDSHLEYYNTYDGNLEQLAKLIGAIGAAAAGLAALAKVALEIYQYFVG